MAATLVTRDPSTLAAAIHDLTPGSVAHTLVLDALPAPQLAAYWEAIADIAWVADVQRAEYATERYLEDRGYDEARGQEAWEAQMGIPV